MIAPVTLSSPITFAHPCDPYPRRPCWPIGALLSIALSVNHGWAGRCHGRGFFIAGFFFGRILFLAVPAAAGVVIVIAFTTASTRVLAVVPAIGQTVMLTVITLTFVTVARRCFCRRARRATGVSFSGQCDHDAVLA